MASDLIERLRDGICVKDAATAGVVIDLDATVRLMRQAADTLAAQAAEIEQMKRDEQFQHSRAQEYARLLTIERTRADALAARVAELEAALKRIVEEGTTTELRRVGDAYDPDGYDEITVWSPLVEIAEAALHPKAPAPAGEGGEP